MTVAYSVQSISTSYEVSSSGMSTSVAVRLQISNLGSIKGFKTQTELSVQLLAMQLPQMLVSWPPLTPSDQEHVFEVTVYSAVICIKMVLQHRFFQLSFVWRGDWRVHQKLCKCW